MKVGLELYTVCLHHLLIDLTTTVCFLQLVLVQVHRRYIHRYNIYMCMQHMAWGVYILHAAYVYMLHAVYGMGVCQCVSVCGYLQVLYGAGREGLVVPTAVAERGSDGFRGSWVTLTQCQNTLERGREGEGMDNEERERERGKEGGR